MSRLEPPKSEYIFSHPINTTRIPFKRLKHGLRLLKEILRYRHNGKIITISPSMIKRYIENATHGDITSIGYALRYWEEIGYVLRTRGRPARYLLLPNIIMLMEAFGCLTSKCGQCRFYGTLYCPFLEGVNIQ